MLMITGQNYSGRFVRETMEMPKYIPDVYHHQGFQNFQRNELRYDEDYNVSMVHPKGKCRIMF